MTVPYIKVQPIVASQARSCEMKMTNLKGLQVLVRTMQSADTAGGDRVGVTNAMQDV